MHANYNPIESNLDAFSRLRISQPQTLFDSKQLVDKQPLFWDDQQISGSGTTSTYLTRIAVSNLTVGTRVRQTFQRFNYQSSKSFAIFMTGVLGTGGEGITKRIGYFDANNGCIFQLSNSVLSVVIRSNISGSPVNNVINQSDWNLDKVDGYGKSGINLDVSKTQIFVIDFQWLGVGRVRFGFDIGGQIIYVHQINHANILDVVWMSIPNLPLRYEISNDGTGAANFLDHICSSVISEGGRDKVGFVLTADRGITGLTTLANTNIYPLIAIRLKSTHLMANIDELLFSILCTSATSYRYAVLLNPSVTGTAFSFSSITNSAIEAATTTTNATTVSGGTLLLSGYVDAGAVSGNQDILISEIPNDLHIGSSIAGVSDILVVAIQLLSGSAETFLASLTWREII